MVLESTVIYKKVCIYDNGKNYLEMGILKSEHFCAKDKSIKCKFKKYIGFKLR